MMPEQLTRHPDVTLQVLKSAGGARCGEGAPQQILKDCPTDRFCALPGGEICVYGLPEATRMTQIKPAELVAAAGGAAPPAPAVSATQPADDPAAWGLTGGALLVGLVIGALVAGRHRGR